MDYIQELQQRLNQASQEANIRRLIDDAFYKVAPDIIALNISQIDSHEGFDDKPLINKIKTFRDGVYSGATEAFSEGANTSKVKGEPYNFNWTGDFLGNFNVKAVGKGFTTFSTGTGGGDKQRFFEGYDNMFGLNAENTQTIESEVLYYVLEKTLTNMYG